MWTAAVGRSTSHRTARQLLVSLVAIAFPFLALGQFSSPDKALRRTGLAGPSDSSGAEICSPSPNVAYAVWIDSSHGASGFSGDINLSKTTNGGATWSAATRVKRTLPAGMLPFGPPEVRITCDASSRVVVLWREAITDNDDLYAVSSIDGAATWREVKRLNTDEFRGKKTLHSPEIATDGSGTVYAAWSWSWSTESVSVSVSTDAGLTWGAPQIVDSGNGGTSPLSLVARSGGFAHVTWADSSGKIWASSTTTAGASWLAAKRLDNDATPASTQPRIALEPAGSRVYVVWQRAAGLASMVYVNVSTNNGSTWGTAARVDHASAGTKAELPDIAVTAGAVHVAWQDNRTGATHVWATRSTNFGSTWASPDQRLDPGNTAGTSSAPRLAASGTDAGVAWLDTRRGGQEPYANRSHDTGATWLGDQRLDTGTAAATTAGQVRLAHDTSTGWFAIWNDRRNDARPSADNDIFANHSSNSGDTWNAADTRLDSTPSMSNSAAMLPAVASDGTGRVFAAWMDERDGRQDIYANCSADHGATWRVNDVRLDTNTSAGSAASFVPRVCTDGSGCVYVAWTEMGNGSSPSVYFNKSCDLCSTWLASPVRVDHAGTQASMINPAFLSCDASGNVYLGWSDDRVTGSGSDQDMDAYVNVSHDRGSTWQFPTDTKVNGTGVSGAWLDGMTSDASGHVYVLFNAANGPLGTWHYHVNRSWDAGNTWRGAIDLAGGIVGAPPNGTTIAADNSGGAYIAWFDARNGAYDVFVRRSVTNGDPPWSTDQRLDGDALGANSSFNVVMAADAGNVLVTWTDDRTGKDQVFANRSTDQGATWLASAVQVDTGDAPGAHQSAMTEGFIVPTVALRGSNARVTWVDNRNSCGGKPGFDTYVNYSENAGQSWHAASIRVEAGDGPGCSDAAWPALSFSADRWTHVAWVDHRSDYHSIRSNSALGLADDDGDGRFGPEFDCNDASNTVWSIPGEARALIFTTKTALTWSAPLTPGGTAPLYDTLRSSIASDFGATATCLESDGTDNTTAEPSKPVAANAYFYLVRAKNSCGVGTLGARSNGVQRTGRACP